MRRNHKHFTLVEVLMIFFVILVVLALLYEFLFSSSISRKQHRERHHWITCTNNLKQIGIALQQYQMMYEAAPAYNAASATATVDGNSCAANLMRLYSCELNEDLAGFRCPFDKFAPAPEVAKADSVTVRDDPDGAKYTSYNLTTCYDMNDPANKIIVADMPYALGNVAASIHDETPAEIDRGPNCLFKDGAVRNVKNLCPEGSSERDLSPSGNIYRVDGGEGKGKDTCILGAGR